MLPLQNKKNKMISYKRNMIRCVKALVLLCLTPQYAMANTPYNASETDSICIVKMLSEARQLPLSACLPLHFARQFIGRPYVAHTLESKDGKERLVVNTRQLDCTTLVETVTALTLCTYRHLYTYRDYQHTLLSLRYRDGRMNGYASRLHYFTDWIVQNSRVGVVKEIQGPVPPFSALQRIRVGYMSSHPQSYSALKFHPELIAPIRASEEKLNGLEFRFIPKAQVVDGKELRSAVRDGDIIAITCSKPGLDIAHLGFAVWQKDGLHLLNASQLHHQVVLEPMTLGQYLKKHPSHTGIRVLRIQK